MHVKEVGREVVNWIHLVGGRVHWLGSVKTFGFNKMRGISWAAKWLSASEEDSALLIQIHDLVVSKSLWFRDVFLARYCFFKMSLLWSNVYKSFYSGRKYRRPERIAGVSLLNTFDFFCNHDVFQLVFRYSSVCQTIATLCWLAHLEAPYRDMWIFSVCHVT